CHVSVRRAPSTRSPTRRSPDPAAAKARGQLLGNQALAKANQEAAAERAEALRPVFDELAGLSAHKAADALNSRNVATPTGAKWRSEDHTPELHSLTTLLCRLLL